MTQDNTIITLDMSHLWPMTPDQRRRRKYGDGAAVAHTIAAARDELSRSGPPTETIGLSELNELLELEKAVVAVKPVTLEELHERVKSEFDAFVAEMDTAFGEFSTPTDFSADADSDTVVRDELASNLSMTFGPRYTSGIYASLAHDIHAFYRARYALLPNMPSNVISIDDAREDSGEDE